MPNRRLMVPFLFSVAAFGAALMALAPGAPRGLLIVCGWDELFILDPGRNPPEKIWSWRAANRPELPEAMRAKFRTIDESKPVNGGRDILITASSGGAALIERETGKVKFYASAANAHSAELLPGNRIVVAASHSPAGDGDRLILFDAATSDKRLFDTELSWAHGAVWDGERQLLWALSDTDLRAYRLVAWDTRQPSLARAAGYELPDRGGHDLYAVAETPLLSLTTGRHCWLFDRETRKLSPHPQLDGRAGVKCITVNPATRQIVWVLSEGGNWWTDKLRFLDPEAMLTLPGERIYKARWLPETGVRRGAGAGPGPGAGRPPAARVIY